MSMYDFHRALACPYACALALAFVSFSVQAQAPAAKDVYPQTTASHAVLNLSTGQQKTLVPAFKPLRIAVGSPSVLDVQVLRGHGGADLGAPQLLLTAKSVGSSSLMVWPKQGGEPQRWDIQVSGSQLILERKLESMLDHATLLASHKAGLPANT
ncbi:MAG: pilus assembly protein N-terminal domain-containing protein, partial [Comamonas sp.]|nr:pilus assembly protein N-terminal domain-containing protein [Candidatus Comamonas equi]